MAGVGTASIPLWVNPMTILVPVYKMAGVATTPRGKWNPSVSELNACGPAPLAFKRPVFFAQTPVIMMAVIVTVG